MPRPVLTATFKQTRVTVAGTQPYAHTGGHVLVFIWVATGGSNTATNTCTINGSAATMIVDRALTGTHTGRWRVYASAAAIAASTVNIQVGAGTQLDHFGGLYYASITDWDGTLGTLDGSNLGSDAFSSPRNVVHAGALDCVIGCWGARTVVDTTGTIAASTATSQIAAGGGLTGLAAQDPAYVRSILVQPTTQPASAGTAALAVSQASWGPNVAWQSFGIAFHGTLPVPPGNPPVLAAVVKGFFGDLAAANFSYVHTGGAVLVAVHAGEGASGSGCTVNGSNCGAVIASHAISTSTIKIWASPVELPAGTYNVTVAGASGRGEVCVNSITNWTRSVTAVTKAVASSFTGSMTVSGITGDDLVVAWWGFARTPWTNASFTHGADQSDANNGSTSNGSDWSSFFIASRKNTRAEPSATLTATTSFASPVWVSMALALRGGAFVPISTLFTQAVGGSLSFSGAVTDEVLRRKSLDSTLSFSGVLARRMLFVRALTGTLTFSGTPAVKGVRVLPLAGLLSFSGVLTRFANLRQALFGFLRFAGDLVADKLTSSIKIIISGALSFSGGVARRIKVTQFVTGTLSFLGTLVPKGSTKLTVSGMLSFLGSLAARPPVKLDMGGSLGFSGGVQTRFTVGQIVDGLLSFSGSVVAGIINASRRFIVAAQRRTGYKRFGDNP